MTYETAAQRLPPPTTLIFSSLCYWNNGVGLHPKQLCARWYDVSIPKLPFFCLYLNLAYGLIKGYGNPSFSLLPPLLPSSSPLLLLSSSPPLSLSSSPLPYSPPLSLSSSPPLLLSSSLLLLSSSLLLLFSSPPLLLPPSLFSSSPPLLLSS